MAKSKKVKQDEAAARMKAYRALSVEGKLAKLQGHDARKQRERLSRLRDTKPIAQPEQHTSLLSKLS